MDIADCLGVPLRRVLRSAERLSESAILRGLLEVNTPFSRSSASLRSITARDHRFWAFAIIVTARCTFRYYALADADQRLRSLQNIATWLRLKMPAPHTATHRAYRRKAR